MIILNLNAGKNLNIALIFIFSAFFCQSLSSQFYWQKTYSINFFDVGNDVCKTPDGNFVIAGVTTISGGNTMLVLKIDNNGDTLWSRVLTVGNPPFTEEFHAVAPTEDGGVVLTGTGADSTFIVKLDQNGNLDWQYYYEGYFTQCFDILKTVDGGFIACGRVNSTGSEGYIIKINSTGQLEWQKIYPWFRGGFSSVDTASDGYVITGDVKNSFNDTIKALVLKINYNGDTLWHKKYKINNRGAIGKKIVSYNDGYLIGGTTIDSSVNNQLFYIRTDLKGVSNFSKTFNTNDKSDFFNDIIMLSNNKYVICYDRDSIDFHMNTYGMIVDSSGNIIQKKIFSNSPAFTWGSLRKIISLNNGDLLFAGTAKLINNAETDVYAVRTDSLLNTPLYIGISSHSETIPEDFILYQNYPNPFNPNTIFRYVVKSASDIKIEIYDILGKNIKTLINKYHTAGFYNLSWQTDNISSGIYLAVMYQNNQAVKSIKISLVK